MALSCPVCRAVVGFDRIISLRDLGSRCALLVMYHCSTFSPLTPASFVEYGADAADNLESRPECCDASDFPATLDEGRVPSRVGMLDGGRFFSCTAESGIEDVNRDPNRYLSRSLGKRLGRGALGRLLGRLLSRGFSCRAGDILGRLLGQRSS